MTRRALTVHGIVQGVGFRPFVYSFARELCLKGFVRNDAGTVRIEIEGEPDSINRFCAELANRSPPLAAIDRIALEPLEPRGDRVFRIEPSSINSASAIFISPDVATCDACLAELFDPENRRFRYPFLNCTDCGPRLTIIQGAPYDRPRTTMAQFPMCADCRREYDDPANRRFHAQPTACSHCGPQLQLLDGCGQRVETADPVADFANALREGLIGAVKGLGGYHLACDAGNENAVRELRRRKQRDEKPFAVMVADANAAEAICEIGPAERKLLVSARRPIVLLRTKSVGDASRRERIATEVAPGNPYLGVFLPYTPLHALLVNAVDDRPLVMTSGNRSDEPIAYRDDDAASRLDGIADLFLANNRPIHVRCDDSVMRVIGGVESPIRRSRGYAPQPIRLPIDCARPLLAVGGQFKGIFALGRDHSAFVSHHLGDLDHFDAYQAFVRDEALYEDLFAIRPGLIVHDLHPDYATTRYALERAAKEGVPALGVQHHHAHVASCLAENGRDEPVIGVAFDGTGFGLDGAIWGGEFLVADLCESHRAAHFRYLQLPGGDRTIREPWRSAAAHLLDAGEDLSLLNNAASQTAVRAVARMIERRFNSVPTSSAGRLFDAVAAIAGVRAKVRYEGQAAMELEWLATDILPDGSYPFVIEEPTSGTDADGPLVVDTRPLIRAVVADRKAGVEAARIARRFHSTLVNMIGDVCQQIRERTGLSVAALTGGVFMNALLVEEVTARLTGAGFKVLRHRTVPANDGGLALGQLAIGAARDRRTVQYETGSRVQHVGS
jgi:hydrogenase maturation protein HypF